MLGAGPVTIKNNEKMRLPPIFFIWILCFSAGSSMAHAEPVTLDAWKFSPGDDPAWAAPDFDDSSWREIEVPDAWSGEGYPEHDQFGWYRLRLDTSMIDVPPGDLAVRVGMIRNAYELYAGGELIGGVGKLPPYPQINYDRVAVIGISPTQLEDDGTLVLALRVWGGSDLAVNSAGGGPYSGAIVIDDYRTLLRTLYLEQLPRIIFASLFLLTGVYFLYLFYRSPSLSSFFWFGVNSLILAPYIVTQSQWKYTLDLSFVALEKIESVTVFLFLAGMVQLIWSVLERPIHWLLRVYQGYFVLLALVFMVIPGLDIHYHLRTMWQLSSLVAIVPTFYVIFDEIRQGNRDAKTLLVAVVVFVGCAVNDLLINAQVFDGVRLMSVGFLAMLAGMGVSLANKFIDMLDDLELEVIQRTTELSELNSQLERANQSLVETSRIDPLTGLLNRRGFADEAETERQRYVRTREPLALLIVDVDHFKRFNDEHGHACGDLVLLEVAETMKAHLRDVDRVARWGGEEFLLLFPGTDADGVANIAEKLRHWVEEATVEHEGKRLNVTATFGGSVYREGEMIEAAIARADEALYRGKSNGRNRVEIAG